MNAANHKHPPLPERVDIPGIGYLARLKSDPKSGYYLHDLKNNPHFLITGPNMGYRAVAELAAILPQGKRSAAGAEDKEPDSYRKQRDYIRLIFPGLGISQVTIAYDGAGDFLCEAPVYTDAAGAIVPGPDAMPYTVDFSHPETAYETLDRYLNELAETLIYEQHPAFDQRPFGYGTITINADGAITIDACQRLIKAFTVTP